LLLSALQSVFLANSLDGLPTMMHFTNALLTRCCLQVQSLILLFYAASEGSSHCTNVHAAHTNRMATNLPKATKNNVLQKH